MPVQLRSWLRTHHVGRRAWRLGRRLLRYCEASHIDELVHARFWLVSEGYPTEAIDQQLDRYRALYHQLSGRYGASDLGMVRWLYERV